MPSAIHPRPDPSLILTKDPVLQSLHPARVGDKYEDNFLKVSPYDGPLHRLDLPTVGTSQKLLATALTLMKPTKEHERDFSTAKYAASFNWDEIVQRLQYLVKDHKYQWQRQDFYVIVFRSRLPPTTDRLELARLDINSHQEATKSGGLLKYWFGEPDAAGRNLATCIWRAQIDVAPACKGTGHKEAMSKTRDMYLEWRVERLRFTIEDDAKGWSMENWN